jgi:hypothetical protein
VCVQGVLQPKQGVDQASNTDMAYMLIFSQYIGTKSYRPTVASSSVGQMYATPNSIINTVVIQAQRLVLSLACLIKEC